MFGFWFNFPISQNVRNFNLESQTCKNRYFSEIYTKYIYLYVTYIPNKLMELNLYMNCHISLLV